MGLRNIVVSPAIYNREAQQGSTDPYPSVYAYCLPGVRETIDGRTTAGRPRPVKRAHLLALQGRVARILLIHDQGRGSGNRLEWLEYSSSAHDHSLDLSLWSISAALRIYTGLNGCVFRAGVSQQTNSKLKQRKTRTFEQTMRKRYN